MTGGALILGMLLGARVVEFPVESLELAPVPEFALEGFIGLPGFPMLELPALTPGLLGTSEPEGPGTELPTAPDSRNCRFPYFRYRRQNLPLLPHLLLPHQLRLRRLLEQRRSH